MNTQLVQKYNIAAPRYTSYPTVPCWDPATFSEAAWIQTLQRPHFSLDGQTTDRAISLYIHLSFCESLCTFCGCNKRITRNHGVEEPYIDTLLKEWALYSRLLTSGGESQRPQIAELHLGGGTPSFFKPENLKRLLDGLFQLADPADRPDYSWEGHPGNTTAEHLQTLFDFGFRRVSFGVQDYDPTVQQAIHRIQSFEQVKEVTELARAIGYESVGHDLIYGLPLQRVRSVMDTVEKTLLLRPDRIAFYSYAHVPWLKGNGQRGFRDEDLPVGEKKRTLYETGRTLLEEGGYAEIGMDHFALPHDPLFLARENGRLHRNFMGYTTTRTSLLIGLGASSIGDTGGAFAQNEKEVEAYQRRVNAGELPLQRGHLLSREDRRIRQYILDLMCRYETTWNPADWDAMDWIELKAQLEDFRQNGLIDYCESGVRIREEGQPFLRTICLAFDKRARAKTREKVFSQTL